MRRIWLAVALPGAALLLTSCAEEVKDVNRVQPHYFDKALLKGEWYYRQTIVDVPPDVGIGFTGLEGKVEKVKFDFVGDSLVARRTHEGIRGLEENETQPGANFQGDVVLFVDDVSHFDIVRDFNTSTGAQSNVIAENTSLKPWHERQYFRADWSTTSALGSDFARFLGAESQGTYWSRETEIANPDHFQADLEDGTINFTTSYTVTDFGYTCFMEYGFYRSTTNTRNSCGLGEVKVRHSFHRIDQEDAAQFEPRSYLDNVPIADDAEKPMSYLTVSMPKADGSPEYVNVECTDEVLQKLQGRYTAKDCKTLTLEQMGRFGFFRTERYDVNRRITAGHDSLRHFYANHHKIWEQVYEWEMTKDEEGAPVIAVDESGKPKLKRDAAGEPIAIPVKNRKPRPIVYYLNVNFPEDLKATAQTIAQDWNQVFMNAVSSAKGISESALKAELKKETGEESMFRIVDNTCTRKGVEAYLARVPEMAEVVAGVSMADGAAAPKGNAHNILSGNLEPICSALTSESRSRGVEKFTYQQVGDIRFNFSFWVNEDQPSGPLGFGPSGPDAETGRIISGNAYIYGAAIDGYARDSMDIVRYLNGDIGDAFEEITSGDTITDWLNLREKSVADQALTVTDAQRADLKKRFSALQLKDPERLRAENGKIDLSRMSQDMVSRAEIRSGTDPMFNSAAGPEPMEMMKDRLRKNPELRSRMLPKPVLSLLYRLFQWNPAEHPDEEMPQELLDAAIDMAANPASISEHMQKRAAFYMDRNITLPEFFDDAVVGKAISLKGESPEEVYRIIREEVFRGVMLHEIGHTLGMTHNFRASHDALNYFDDFWAIQDHTTTDAERDAELQPEYRYTSIMDYGARFNSDLHGLGKYDNAAIKFAYTGLVERFEDDVTVPSRLDLHLEYDDYKKIPEMLGGDSSLITRRKDVPVGSLVDDLRAGIRENGDLFAGGEESPNEYWRDRTVPYFYCIDWYNGRDPKCRTWDEGPTHEEAVRSAIQRYWNYYFFNSWRRGRDDYQFYFGFFSRMGRLMPYLNYPYKHYAFFQQYENRDGTPLDTTEDLLRASVISTNFVMQALGTPEAGWYCRYETDQGEFTYLPFYVFGANFDFFRSEDCDRYELPMGQGRSMYIELSDDYDTHWNYMGTFFEKQNFVIPMLNAGTVFLRPPVNAYGELDFRFGYYDVFKDRLLSLTQDILDAGLGEFGNRKFQWQVKVDDKGDRVVGFPNFFDFSTLDERLDDEPAPNAGDEPPPSPDQVWVNTPFDLMRYWLFAAGQLNSRPGDKRLDFYEYLAIQEKGSGDDRQFSDDASIRTFVNPKTGQIFEAPQTADRLSIAHRVLGKAKSAAEAWTSARAELDDDPESANLQEDLEDADQNLEFYLSIIDDMRLLRSVMDLGK